MLESMVQERDFVIRAREIVEKAIGERMDGSLLKAVLSSKDTKAVARGRLGGLKGGSARAKKLSAKRRKQIAQKAANSRWKSA